MLSVYSQAPAYSVAQSSQCYVQLGNMNDAVSSFTNMTILSGKAAVRLYCTIPTWSSATDTCVDLHDLHELKSRALVLIHELTQSLRASGVTASYSLAPSNLSLCVVSQQPANLDVLEKARQCSTELERGKLALITIDENPCLVLA